MKKGNMTTLASIFIMASIVFSLGLGTMAYFSDVELSENNEFVAGTIDLNLDEIVTLGVGDLKPCEVGYIVFYIHNIGTNPMRVWKHIFNVETSEGLKNPEPEMTWYTEHPNDPRSVDPGRHAIDEVILYDMYIYRYHSDGGYPPLPDDPLKYPEYLETFFIPIITEADLVHINDIECWYILLGELEPCDVMIVVQSYHMEFDTENWAQGDDMTFDVEFYAEQLTGPGPDKVFVLPGTP